MNDFADAEKTLATAAVRMQVERKLASVRKIDDIRPIEGADAIEVAVLGGWKVVVKKGEYTPGDLAVYCEIDCWIPTEIASFLSKGKEPRVYEGIKGEKLRTVKLRGQISQGLLLPMDVVDNITVTVGDDVTSHLGIVKWEPVLPANMAGQVKGLFPSFIRKTDQERCQNLIEEIFVENKDARYEVTMKLDGSSVTGYRLQKDSGVCSRNLELKVNDENKDNALVKMFQGSMLQAVLDKIAENLAVQGELMGPGIQGNRENFKDTKFFIFDVQFIDDQEYMRPDVRARFMQELLDYGVDGQTVQHVPVLHMNVTLADLGIFNVEDLLKFAEGPSINHQVREGVVFKRMDGKFSFKAISNKFLEREKD
jgi:RNA ligase (TIGR02306 family)